MGLIDQIKNIFNKNNENNLISTDDNIAISVNHLTMEFKVTKDKIDTLKEYVIRTIKRNKKGKAKVIIISSNIWKTIFLKFYGSRMTRLLPSPILWRPRIMTFILSHSDVGVKPNQR